MHEKVGRNDPCPCGSGKKYKQCHLKEAQTPKKRKFSANVLGGQQPQQPKSIDLMERTFGNGIARTKGEFAPAPPENPDEPVPNVEKGPLPL